LANRRFRQPLESGLARADKSLRLALRHRGGQPVDVLIDYYSGSGKDHSLVVAPDRLWDERRYNLVDRASASPVVDNRPVQFQEFLLTSPTETRLVWWSYWKDGRFTASGTAIKWMAIRDILGGRSGAALVAISVPVTDSRDQARARLRSAAWILSGLAGKRGD